MSERKWTVCAGDPAYVSVGTAKPINCGSKERARLIAAAPEMYEALKTVATIAAEYVGEYGPSPGGTEVADIEEAFAALAKAEGRAASHE